MSDGYGVPENWKEALRDDFLQAMYGNTEERKKSYSRIGYAYQCYAPTFIYKYYRPSERNLKAIADKRLWFSSPLKFNDVFDTDLPIDRDSVFNSLLLQVAGSAGIRKGSPAWRNAYAEMCQQEKQFSKQMEHVRQTTGIACFSESCDSILMWSHYAQNHQGLCVEYELLNFSSKLQFAPVPVVYSSERACLSSIDMKNMERDAKLFYMKGLTSKAPDWSYEREWRIIRDSGACGADWNAQKQGALLSSISPSSIILGCAAPEAFENTVRKFCEDSRISLFKMEEDRTEYKLIKKPLLRFDT